MQLIKLILTISLAVPVTFPVQADESHHPAGATANSSSTNEEMTEGEVKDVDKESGRLTLRHGALKNLGIPSMTTVFRVKDPLVLDQLKSGDKVRFLAETEQGGLTVTRLELAR